MRGISVIKVAAAPGVKRFRLVGELDLTDVPSVRRVLHLVREFPEDVQLDLSELTYLSSAGASLFSAIARELAGRGRLYLLFPSTPVLRTLDLLEVEKESVNLVVIRHPCRQGNGSATKHSDARFGEASAMEEASTMLESEHDGSGNSATSDRFGEFRGLRELGKVVASLWGQRTGTRPRLARGDLREDRAIFVLCDALPVEHRQLAALMRRHSRLRDLYERLWREILPRLARPARRLIGRTIHGGTAKIKPELGGVALELYLGPRLFV